MKKRIMGKVRHACAKTMQDIRTIIYRSQATTAALKCEPSIIVKVIAKWRKRETVEDREPDSTHPNSTVLRVDKDVMVGAFSTQ